MDARGSRTRTGPSDILEFGQLDDDTCGELDCSGSRGTVWTVGPTSRRTKPRRMPPQLDQIETGDLRRWPTRSRRLTTSVRHDPDHQFRPQLCRGPEIELVFHHAHNPFGERFEEEEVIVDPLASLETTQRDAARSRCPTSESRSPNRDPHVASGNVTVRRRTVDDAEFDPVLPENADEEHRTPLSCADASATRCRATIAICWRSWTIPRKFLRTMPWRLRPTARDVASTASCSHRCVVNSRRPSTLQLPVVSRSARC